MVKIKNENRINIYSYYLMKIVHIGDIHIKSSRTIEYDYVFKQLYELINIEKPDYTIVCGDIFDEKSAAEATVWTKVSDFLVNLAKHSKLIVIQGNHDVDILYRSGELLSALINIHKDLQTIHYFPKSGIYELEDIIIGVLSPYKRDKKITITAPVTSNLPDRPNLPDRLTSISEIGSNLPDRLTSLSEIRTRPDLPKIALFHEDYDEIPSIFINFDLIIGGHIHQRDDHYCGSLIKQTIAETGPHGGLIWTFKDNKFTKQEFNLYNPYECFKLSITNDNYDQIDIKNLPSHPNYWYIETDKYDERFTTFIQEMSKLFKKSPSKVIMPKAVTAQVEQNDYSTIIKDLLKDNKYTEEVIKMFYENNNKDLDGRNLINLQTLTFKDIFCFEDGLINFEKFHGITGINAANESGKSSFLKIIICAIFGAQILGLKASEIVKYGKNSGKIEITLNFKDSNYKITRTISNTNSLLSIIKDDVDISKASKPANEELIKSIFGNPESIVNASFIMQNSEHALISATPKFRRETLAYMLNITGFADKKDISAQLAEINGKLQILKPKTHNKAEILAKISKISAAKKRLVANEFKHITINPNTIPIENSLAPSELLLRKQLNDSYLSTLSVQGNITTIKDRIKKHEDYLKFKPYHQLLSQDITLPPSFQPVQPLVNYTIDNLLSIIFITNNQEDYNIAKLAVIDHEANIKKMNEDIDYYKSEIEKYNKYRTSYSNSDEYEILKQYDTDNSECGNCQKIHAKCLIMKEHFEDKVIIYDQNIDMFNGQIIEISLILSNEMNNYHDTLAFIKKYEYHLSLSTNIDISDSRHSSAIDISVAYYYLYEVLRTKDNYDQDYTQLLVELQKLSCSQYDESIDGMILYQINESDPDANIDTSNVNISELPSLEYKLNEILMSESRNEEYLAELKKFEILSAYKSVTDTGGISSVLIDKKINKLTSLVNEIIGGGLEISLTDYTLLYNGIPASCASGYRKMIISLALNIVLWKLTTGPVINGIFIDEGLASCDKDNLEKTLMFIQELKYLPDMPKNIVLISHSEHVKTHFDTELLIKNNKIANTEPQPTIVQVPSEFSTSDVDSSVGWCNLCDPQHKGRPMKIASYNKSHKFSEKHVSKLT